MPSPEEAGTSPFIRHSTVLTGQGFVPKEQEAGRSTVCMVGGHVTGFGLSGHNGRLKWLS